MNLKRLRKIDWQYLANRKESLLFSSTTDSPYGHQKFKKTTGLNWRANFTMRFSDGDLFHDAKDLAALSGIFTKGGTKTLTNFRQRLIFKIKNFDKLARKIEKTNCRILSQKQLVNLTKKYFEDALETHNFLLPMPVADRVLSKIILERLPAGDEKEKQKWLGILAYPSKENEHTKEERAFYKLAESCQKQKNTDRLIEKYLKKFAKIGTRGYWWHRAWKKEDVEERLKEFFASKKIPRKEIKNLDVVRKERKIATNKLLKKLKIKSGEPLYKLIFLAKDFAHLRTWRTDLIYGAGYLTKNLFFEIAERAGVHPNDLGYLTFYEVIQLSENLKMPIDAKELKNRKKYTVAVTVNNNYRVFSGQAAYKKLKTIVEEKINKTGETKGNIAYPGKITGEARVVLTGDDIKKVKQGDVLVTVMTFPNFVPAMEKAAAFVTDEGGILCHAAIISREMRKPCIIATKIATKVFKDGDLVEVDAEKGIVRKIYVN